MCFLCNCTSLKSNSIKLKSLNKDYIIYGYLFRETTGVINCDITLGLRLGFLVTGSVWDVFLLPVSPTRVYQLIKY